MISLLLLWVLAGPPDPGPCEHGGKGAQCVTCVPSDRGTVVCRGVCYYKDPKTPRADAGFRSASLKTEDKDEKVAKAKMDDQAKEKCP